MKTWKTKSGYQIIQILSGRSNAFLLTNGENNILIDTGPGFMWRTLDKRLSRLKVSQIDYLILSHAHFDHAANAQKIRDRYGALVIVHRDEMQNLITGDGSIPHGTNPITRFMVNFLAKKISPLFRFTPCQYDILADERLDMHDMGFNAYILHTPGHSPGSISVIVDDKIALVGDAMFGIFRWSVFPPFANDVKSLFQSWGKLLETNCKVFLPSHGSANLRKLVQKNYNERINIMV